MIWVPNNFDSSKPLLSPPIQSDVDAQSAIPTVSAFDSAVDKCSGVVGAMGSCASKSPPRKPNPYVSRDASDHLQATPHTRAVRETRRSRSFPSSSPTKKELHGSTKAKGGAVLAVEGEVEIVELDKNFGLSNKFASVFEVGEEIGRGQFGYTCSAVAKKGELKGLKVAVKIIPKSKMTTTVAIEDVRREIKILQTFTEHSNLAQFYGAFEDFDNVYIVMELCRGGELLDKMRARGGRYSEEDAKAVIIQIMKAVAFLHLYGVVHRDIKPENFLFASQDENSQLKVIDFGLSDFVRHDNKLTDTVGSAYYAAPEVLQKSYDTGADVWSVGVIAYIILCGSRPFWAQTDSGIYRTVTEANLNFDENPWPSLSPESKDFVRCLLHGDPRLRVTAAQALCHPWLQQHVKLKVPLDVLIFKLLKAYMKSSYLRKAALRALSKTLTADELYYPKEQFALLYPDERGGITLETIKMALVQNATGATKSHIADLLEPLNALQYRRMYFGEFCAAALNVPQLEALDSWGDRISNAYNIFDQNGNRVIVIEELASELELSPSMSVHAVLQEWVRQSDGKLTFLGFSKLICRRMPTHQDRLELKNGHHRV